MSMLSPLSQSFSIDRAPWPGAEARIDRVIRLANHGDFEDAGRTAEALIEEGVHDVKVLVRFFFGVFLEHGFAALPPLFDGLASTLEGASGALGQSGARLRGDVEVALVWLCRTVRDRVDFHQVQRDEVFSAWVAACDADRIEAMRAGVARLRGAVERILPGSRSLEHLAALDAFASGPLRTFLAKPALPVARPLPAAVPAVAAAPTSEPDAELLAAPPSPRPVLRRARTRRAGDAAPVPEYEAPALRLLKQKIAGFESLMARGELARAAIVARDIERIVGSFDPRVYFPRLFADFYKRLAGGVEALSPHLGDTESHSSKALEQLYQVDLHAFLDDL